MKVRWSHLKENAPRGVAGLLAGLIVVDAVHALLPLMHLHPAPPKPSAALAARAYRRHGPPPVDVPLIVAAHLFGRAARQSLNPDDALPTTANLELQGTIAFDDPKRGCAIIAAGGAQKVYKVGDPVGGASLNSVYVTKVLLDRDGQLESLALPRFSGSPGAKVTAPPRFLPAPESGDGVPQHHIADILRSSPAMDRDSDKLIGFRISPLPPVSRLQQSGLRAGDLVTAVNGAPLAEEDLEGGKKILDAALADNTATFTVMRNGRPLDVSVSASP